MRSNFCFLIYRKIKYEVLIFVAGDKFTMVIYSSDKISYFLYVLLYLSIMSWHLFCKKDHFICNMFENDTSCVIQPSSSSKKLVLNKLKSINLTDSFSGHNILYGKSLCDMPLYPNTKQSANHTEKSN